MRKGISPIVAVVLLIAIAVIAAVGLYFWVGGLATKQPTPNTPIVIGAQKVTCTTQPGNANVTLLVQNLDASSHLTSRLGIIGDNGTCWNSTTVNIGPANQESVTFDCDTPNVATTSGITYVVYSDSTSQSVSQAQVVC